jgi:hypothetical protein
VSAIRRTSASAASNAGEPNDGGGAGRNWSPLSMKNVRAWPSSGSSGGRGGSRLLNYMPGPVGTVPVHTASKRSVLARATT